MHTYRAFGLGIRSALPLPLPSEPVAAADVEVVEAAVPRTLPDPLGTGPVYAGNARHLLFAPPPAGRFLVSDGCRITVERVPGASDRLVAWFVICTAMGALLHQRRRFVLHAGAVALPDGSCVVLCGRSGAGKSTTTLALHQRGYPLLTDDICPLTVTEASEEVGVEVLPGYPHARLWRGSARYLGLRPEALPQVREAEDKRLVELDVVRQGPHPVRRIYVLTPRPGTSVHTEALEGAAAFNALYRATYQPWMLPVIDRQRDHFAQGMALVQRGLVRRLVRPEDDLDALPRLLDCLEADLTP